MYSKTKFYTKLSVLECNVIYNFRVKPYFDLAESKLSSTQMSLDTVELMFDSGRSQVQLNTSLDTGNSSAGILGLKRDVFIS